MPEVAWPYAYSLSQNVRLQAVWMTLLAFLHTHFGHPVSGATASLLALYSQPNGWPTSGISAEAEGHVAAWYYFAGFSLAV
jgi:hypothetical protein